MKKIIFAISVGLIFLAGCTGVKSTTSGLENEAFLEFIGIPNNYAGGINVMIDDKIKFNAEVYADHANRPKGNVYAISTGTHSLSVTYNKTVIYAKQIVVSAQETKKIVLP